MLKSQDDKIRQMLHDFGRALIHAIATSSEVSGTVRKIRQEGYSLYLVLDCKQDRERSAQKIELTTRKVPPQEPAFRLDGRDVSFLKELGIDPTRSAKGRRGH